MTVTPARCSGVNAVQLADPAATQHEKMAQCSAIAITIGDPRYPQPLREIFDPPILLFARGRIELLQTLCLGVVGTRRPTPYGVAVAERITGDLAHAGLTIASGMARGIDTAAHKGTQELIQVQRGVLGDVVLKKPKEAVTSK